MAVIPVASVGLQGRSAVAPARVGQRSDVQSVSGTEGNMFPAPATHRHGTTALHAPVLVSNDVTAVTMRATKGVRVALVREGWIARLAQPLVRSVIRLMDTSP